MKLTCILYLQVTLQEPEVVKPKPGHPPPNPQLTSQNHVVWTMELQAGERREVNVHYKVEYPSKQQIEGLWGTEDHLHTLSWF